MFNPSPEQQAALDSLHQFILSDKQIFILKGHAGTGKTTLIKHFIEYLNEKDIPFTLMASTGRAAKVLSHKSGKMVTTVHQGIYKLQVVENDEQNQVRRLSFRLHDNMSPEMMVYIVDESSMLSNEQVKEGFITYGSGRLISDLLLFAEKRKVVFVGDQAQLPPVSSVFSAALTEEYLKERFKIEVSSALLSEVQRYQPETGVFFNTIELRRKIENRQFPYLAVKGRGFSDIFVSPSEQVFVDAYVESVRRRGLDNSIMICFSNARSNDLNTKARLGLFGRRRSQTLLENELLMVIQNNYKYMLFNGDHLQVENYSDQAEYRAGLHFRDVTVSVNDFLGRRLVHVKIIDDLLTMAGNNLHSRQDFGLFRDFAIRMSKEGIRPKDPEFIVRLMDDPYLNALRVKYGYAVTCHKAQGGEWEDVFLLFENCFFINLDKERQHRWAYTAISRTQERLHLLDNRCIY